MKTLKTILIGAAAAVTAGVISSPAYAAQTQGNFNAIAKNIITNISDLPALLSGIAYLIGILLGVLGIIEIKEHVEDPSKKDLKNGAIKLAAGGGLFALPLIYEAMLSLIGTGGNVQTPELNAVRFQTG